MKYQFMRFPRGVAKVVTFSYDDGCRQDIRFADLLASYGLKGTFNLNMHEPGKIGALTKEEVQEHMLSKGHEIAVHGAFHRAPGSLRPVQGIQEVLECRLMLEKTFGILVRGMAYPDSGITRFTNGADYENIRSYLKDLDIVYSRSLGGDNNAFALPTDWYNWIPTAHHDNPQVMEYADAFVKMDLSPRTYLAARQPRLFYIWGHSYEFDQKNNWEHMHTLCKKLANQEDIWYATNMEIYKYTMAYQSLVYSADGTMIYNPTLYTIWLDREGIIYAINPGETLNV